MTGSRGGDRAGEAERPLTRERWRMLEPHLDRALELDGGARAEYLASVAAADPAVGAELARMVALCERDESPLEAAEVDRDALLLDTSGDALFDQLRQALGDRYTLERELGRGGMSRVFIAHEPALGRQVVVKVLTPELAAGVSADRFGREIRLAAALQQANIVPLLATGSAVGLPYYTMPYVDGRSLRDRLARDGALPIGEAIGILRDVARALAYAHAHGVVHRDVKPDNVLLSGGTAVVTDFGIAKAIGDVRGTTDTPTLTAVGTGLGTPAYMAPEQATGDLATDHRADIYAFGCVAYETLTGKPPFTGRSLHALIAAHLRDTPRPLRAARADIPAALEALVARCLEKDPARRPQQAAELLAALDAIPLAPGRTRPTWRTVLLAVGAAAIVVVPALRRGLGTDVAPPLTFAVIPCRNLSGDTALEYRSDGLSDEILTAMARVPGVRVAAPTAAYRYKGRTDFDVRAAASDLGTRLLLTCTLQQRAGRLTMTARLDDAAAGASLLSDTLTHDAADLGGLTDDIVGTIAGALRTRFGPTIASAAQPIPGPGTTNGAALDQYLFGQALVKRRGDGVRQSVASFEHAIALDPKFARAYAALANALELYPYFLGTAPAEVRDRAVNAAQRALVLDSTLAEAHVALGAAFAHAGEWDSATVEFRHALALEPDNLLAHFTFGRFLVLEGRTEEARTQFEEARQIERISPFVWGWLSYVDFAEGRRDTAFAEISRALQLDSTLLPVTNLAGFLNVEAGRREVARRVVMRSVPIGTMTSAPYVLARLGDTASANRQLRALDANEPRPWFADISRATVQLALRDTAGALASLERSDAATGPMWVMFMGAQHPAYDPIRSSPRFAAILRRERLDVARLTGPRGGRRE